MPVLPAVGLDVGGTKVLAGVVDNSGAVTERVMLETPHRSQAPSVVEDTIVGAVERLRGSREAVAVGVGAAGFVGLDGTVRFSPHLSWRNEPLQQVLERRLGLPVVVDNDANAAAWAELKFGAGRGHTSAVLVTLGTGIGGAVIVDDHVLRGTNGMAGEFGHIQVVPDGRVCECGRTGCWEQYCSGRGLVRAALAHNGPAGVDGYAVTEAADAGEPWAMQAFEDVGRWLGIGIAGLVCAFDPEIVLIGGGLSTTGEKLLAPARRAFMERLPGRGFRAEPEIVMAQLGPDAGLIGAADLARRTAQ